MTRLFLKTGCIVLVLIVQQAHAEVISSSADHFHLKLKAESRHSSFELWNRLIDPAQWWHSDHTYSGNANNLTLDLQAGGLWQENLQKGSVAHGRVLFVDAPRLLRLEAPFGPLQALAVKTVWTITVTPKGSGSEVTFEFLANGTAHSNLDQLASAVLQVKTQALQQLIATAD